MNGILLVDKMEGKSSFSLVALLRKVTQIRKIGHTGTLDPFACGLMVMLIGREFTKQSNALLSQEKEYLATIKLGATSSTYDREGTITPCSTQIPTLSELENVLKQFQGDILQVPPMFSAKKVKGQKLYLLARKGIEIERQAEKVHVVITLISYTYPNLDIKVTCSKGTYIRSLAYDIGNVLGCGGYLTFLKRERCGKYLLKDAIAETSIVPNFNIEKHLITEL